MDYVIPLNFTPVSKKTQIRYTIAGFRLTFSGGVILFLWCSIAICESSHKRQCCTIKKPDTAVKAISGKECSRIRFRFPSAQLPVPF